MITQSRAHTHAHTPLLIGGGAAGAEAPIPGLWGDAAANTWGSSSSPVQRLRSAAVRCLCGGVSACDCLLVHVGTLEGQRGPARRCSVLQAEQCVAGGAVCYRRCSVLQAVQCAADGVPLECSQTMVGGG